jgi:hypothetical protein
MDKPVVASVSSFPPVPFERKTKKYGVVTILAIEPSTQGGLVEIDDHDHAPFWVRAKAALGSELY